MVGSLRGETADARAVRAGEELNRAALADYLRGKVEGAESGVSIAQFPSGHSNLTYLVTAGQCEYVLRRGPLGPVPPKAHDMAREHRVLAAVGPHFPEAPRVVHLCQDASVIGAVFFLMERRRGVVLRDRVPAEIAAAANYPARISEAFVRCLVRLHAVNVSDEKLQALGKPDGFLERQVEGWAERWQRAKTEEIPAMDAVIDWLRKQLPASGEPTIVHNDYKLDNVMLPVGEVDRVEAVLDWEMTTIGDPLADLGLTLCYWCWVHQAEGSGSVVPTITAQPGWFGREEFVTRYAELSGRDVARAAYYEVLGVFKLAVILQQIYYRYHRGQTQDARFAHFDQRVAALVAVAAGLAEKSG